MHKFWYWLLTIWLVWHRIHPGGSASIDSAPFMQRISTRWYSSQHAGSVWWQICVKGTGYECFEKGEFLCIIVTRSDIYCCDKEAITNIDATMQLDGCWSLYVLMKEFAVLFGTVEMVILKKAEGSEDVFTMGFMDADWSP